MRPIHDLRVPRPASLACEVEALDRRTAEDMVAAGLCLGRLVPPSDISEQRRVGEWILAAMTERLDLPPLGVIGDLGALLFGRPLDRLRSPVALPAEDPALAA